MPHGSVGQATGLQFVQLTIELGAQGVTHGVGQGLGQGSGPAPVGQGSGHGLTQGVEVVTVSVVPGLPGI